MLSEFFPNGVCVGWMRGYLNKDKSKCCGRGFATGSDDKTRLAVEKLATGSVICRNSNEVRYQIWLRILDLQEVIMS